MQERRNSMKAPDKININNYNGNDTFGNQWHTKPSESPSVASHEYIRKDALLERINETTEILNGMANEGFKRGCQIIIDRLTDIIKSM